MASFGNTVWEPEYLSTDDKDKTRLVGIEFETAIKPMSEIQEKYQFISDMYLAQEGIGEYYSEEYDETEEDYDEKAEFIKDNMNELGLVCGGVGFDGGGREIVTMPDSYNLYLQGGSKRLKELVDFLTKVGIPDRASGTHINISKLESDVNSTWRNLYWFTMCFGPQLQKIFGRITHWARTPLPQNYFTANGNSNEILFEAPKKQPKQTGVYAKGTIIVDKGDRYEFRGPKASNDIDEILAWVELCHNIVEVCARGYIQNVPFADVLNGKYIRKYLNKIGKENPERKISPAERAMRIAEIGYVKIQQIEKVL